MKFDINVIITGLAAPICVLLVKALLDLKLGIFFVKYLSWLPVRGLFRDKPPRIAGEWEQLWGNAGSVNFKDEVDRHSHTSIYQLGRYCYAEFRSKGATYGLFGRLQNQYLIGDWFDLKDSNAYFGAFQLRLVDSSCLEGKYIGHSKRDSLIQVDDWIWRRHTVEVSSLRANA